MDQHYRVHPRWDPGPRTEYSGVCVQGSYRDIDDAHCILDAKFEEELKQFIKPFPVCSPTTLFSATRTRKVDLVRISLTKRSCYMWVSMTVKRLPLCMGLGVGMLFVLLKTK